MSRCILLLGGARSGKSAYAQRLAEGMAERVLFVATAQALDEEMQARIEAHRRARPRHWRTIEATVGLGREIAGKVGEAQVVVIDCLTLLVSNLLLENPEPVAAEERVRREVEDLVACVRTAAATFIVISNEVGLGLVPDNAVGRLYRDLLGTANQRMAAEADEVYLMVAGIPLRVKAGV